jgi:Peptidase_C39 like family
VPYHIIHVIVIEAKMDKAHPRRRTIRSTIPVIFALALCIGFLACTGSSIVYAQAAGNGTEKTPPQLMQVTPLRQNDFFAANRLAFSGGATFEQDIINGPPAPPPGYSFERSSVALPMPDTAAGIKTLTVPAFNWVFGCSSVSGAMIAGYYDRNGYPNIYTGPTNGGLMPLNNSYWPTWSDGFSTYPNLPLAASRQGIDGRVARGSLDDYWVQYNSDSADPYLTNGWSQHSWGDAIGDYMKTSQSAYNNTDGATIFYNLSGTSEPLTCAVMASYGISDEDGTYGRKLFYEARGYTVTDCYNQKTDNTVSGGFNFDQYKAEIDAGRPVMLNLEGHTIVGVGYDDSTRTVYIHDTWDYSTHSMPWGGSYSGMQLLSVSIVNLQAVTPTLTGLTISGPTIVPEKSRASYSAALTLSDGSTISVTPVWHENSSYTRISGDGILIASSVPSNQTLVISASYTSGGTTVSDTHPVTVENVPVISLPWLKLLLQD